MRFASSILKTGVIAAALVLGTTFAKADTLTGSFNINSGDQIVDTMTSSGITFYTQNPNTGATTQVASTGGYSQGIGTVANRTGSFSNLLTYGQGVTFLNPINFSNISMINPVELFYTGATASQGVQFFANSVGMTSGISNSYTFQGFLANNGASQTAGAFTITNVNGGQIASFTSVAATAATPEPNSLMLLGTGFVSAAGMLMRRRKAMTA